MVIYKLSSVNVKTKVLVRTYFFLMHHTSSHLPDGPLPLLANQEGSPRHAFGKYTVVTGLVAVPEHDVGFHLSSQAGTVQICSHNLRGIS